MGPADIHIHDDRLYRRVIRDRELGLGESYQEGWWSANQLDEFLAVAQETNLKRRRAAIAGAAETGRPEPLRQPPERTGRAKKNARAHYDIGNDLFERMLDKRMIYTCAYWRDADDLDSAQEAKLDLICRKLRSSNPACGCSTSAVGGAASPSSPPPATTCTSPVSAPRSNRSTVARENTSGLPVHIEQKPTTGRLDRRVRSHHVHRHDGTRRSLATSPTFFDRCDALLADDGMMLHHTIGSNEWKTHTDPWFDKYIFPGGVLPSLGQISRAAEKTWSIEDVHNFGPDYDRTLMAWHANIDARWHEIPHYDDHFRRTWEYYLMGSAAGFRVRALQLFQVVFTKAKRRRPVYEAVR